eukprot:UN25707
MFESKFLVIATKGQYLPDLQGLDLDGFSHLCSEFLEKLLLKHTHRRHDFQLEKKIFLHHPRARTTMLLNENILFYSISL